MPPTLASTIATLGYHPRLLGDEGRPDQDLLQRLGVAAFLALNIMLIYVSLYAGWYSAMEERWVKLFQWTSLALATPVAFWCAVPFFSGAISGLRHGILHMDLPIALGILSATNDWGREVLERFLFVGELSLDGEIRPVRGTISLAIMARECGLQGIVLPVANAKEAAIVHEIEVRPVSNLGLAAGFVSGVLDLPCERIDRKDLLGKPVPGGPDIMEVKGQASVDAWCH